MKPWAHYAYTQSLKPLPSHPPSSSFKKAGHGGDINPTEILKDPKNTDEWRDDFGKIKVTEYLLIRSFKS